jgi:hypothetical protein
MTYLYCKKHGEEHEATARARQDKYRQLGDLILIVKGRPPAYSGSCHTVSLEKSWRNMISPTNGNILRLSKPRRQAMVPPGPAST